MIIRLYDGAGWCGHCDKCPVADYDSKAGTVTIYDPAKPESGAVTMSAEEYNALIAHARPVGRKGHEKR